MRPNFRAIGLLLAATPFFTNCGGSQQAVSKVSDIYTNDAETRHPATDEEKLWTVSAGNCTASALTHEYVLTAAHCSPYPGNRYTSGAALVEGDWGDLVLTEVVEIDYEMDYAIAKVEWRDGQVPQKQRFSPFIATKEDQVVGGIDGEGTKLFTVGFPADQGQAATYAEGYAKKYDRHLLVFNVPIINGNSGGAVWTSDGKMLVSMTNDGPTQYRMPGWDNNDPEDPAHWNYSVAMYKAYEKSEVLRELFPNGDNKYVDEIGELEAFRQY